MNDYKHCNACNTFHYTDVPCADEYFVSHEDYMGDEWKKIHGNSHYDVAIKYAEYYNTNADYCLMNDTIDILVKDTEGNIEKYKVGAEPSVDYSAIEI